MKVAKPKRVVDRKLLDSYHMMACRICKRMGSDPCHIKSVGSGGDDSSDNLIAFCRDCHVSQHKIGWWALCMLHPFVFTILFEKGWTFDGPRRKLIRDK